MQQTFKMRRRIDEFHYVEVEIKCFIFKIAKLLIK